MENIATSPPLECSGDDDVEAAHNIEEQIDKVLRNVVGLGDSERILDVTHDMEGSSGDADLSKIKWDAVVATSDLNNERLETILSPKIENSASESRSTDKSDDLENPSATQYKKQLDNGILNCLIGASMNRSCQLLMSLLCCVKRTF